MMDRHSDPSNSWGGMRVEGMGWLGVPKLSALIATAPRHLLQAALAVCRRESDESQPCSWSHEPVVHFSDGFGHEIRIAQTVSAASGLSQFSLPFGAIVIASGHKGFLAVFWASELVRNDFAAFVDSAWRDWAGEDVEYVSHYVLSEEMILAALNAAS